MITFNLTLAAWTNKKSIWLSGYDVAYPIGLTMSADVEDATYSWSEDQDVIITTQPESNPYTRENDCFHEKLRGQVNLSLVPPSSASENVALMLVNPTVGATYQLSHKGPGEHGTYEQGTLKITGVSTYDSGKRANVWGTFHGTATYWNSYWEEWRQVPVDSLLIATDVEMEFTRVIVPGSNLQSKITYLQDRLNKWHLHTWLTDRKYFLDIVYRNADSQVHPGTLAASAASKVRALDINTLQYVKDIVEIPAFGSGLVDLGHDLLEGAESAVAITKSVKRNLGEVNLSDISFIVGSKKETVAKAFLAEHYGLKLTIKDTQEIAEAIRKAPVAQEYQTMGSEATVVVDLPSWGTSCEVTTKLTARIGSYDDKQLHCCESINESMSQLSNMVKRAGYELDVLPTASNLWDMVPLSFVADWFLPIGENLALQETRNYMATLPVKCCFITRRTTYDETSSVQVEIASSEGIAKLTGSYTIHHSIYDRRYQDVLPIPPVGQNNTGEGGAFKHVVEGTALLVSSGR